MAMTFPAAPGKGRIIGSWIIRGLLAVAFLGAGGAKLAGVPMMVQLFDQIGLGQGFRYLTALVEIGGALALFVPGATAIAALGLGATMFVAVLTHLFILHTSPAGAVVLLLLSLALAWLHREQIAPFR